MYSNATTFRSKPISFEISNKFVTAFSGVVSFAHFIRKHPLVRSLTASVALVTRRSYNPFNFYNDFDLAVQSVLSVIHGFGAPQDSRILKADPGFKHALRDVASPATLSRWVHSFGDQCGSDLSEELLNRLPKHSKERIGSKEFDRLNCHLLDYALHGLSEDTQILIDADSTFLATYGTQQQSAYCGKNRSNGYFPLLVFLNGLPVHIQNAPGATDGRRLLEGCLPDILQTVREKFPHAPILVRADGGFNSEELISICDRHNTGFLSGFGGNSALENNLKSQLLHQVTEHGNEQLLHNMSFKLINELLFDAPLLTAEPRSYLDRKGSVHRFIGQVQSYRAPSWTKSRNLYYRLEENLQYNEIDLRYVQTNMSAQEIRFRCESDGVGKRAALVKNCPDEKATAALAIDLYDGLYCQRAQCELAIKEFKAVLADTSMSSESFFCNWFRLIIAAAAVHVLNDLRKKAFGRVHKQCFKSIRTIRKQLLCIPAILEEKKNILKVRLSPTYENYFAEFLQLIQVCE